MVGAASIRERRGLTGRLVLPQSVKGEGLQVGPQGMEAEVVLGTGLRMSAELSTGVPFGMGFVVTISPFNIASRFLDVGVIGH